MSSFKSVKIRFSQQWLHSLHKVQSLTLARVPHNFLSLIVKVQITRIPVTGSLVKLILHQDHQEIFKTNKATLTTHTILTQMTLTSLTTQSNMSTLISMMSAQPR